MIRLVSHLERFSWGWSLTSIFVLAVCVAGAASAWTQKDLTVAITTDRESYQVGEVVKVTFTLDNQTGQAIQIRGLSCTPLFDLIVLDPDGREVWRASACPICCCTCCWCPVRMLEREIPEGVSQYPDDVVWRQVRIVDQGRCGCVLAQVEPGVYYLVGKVGDVKSELVSIEIRPQ